MRPVMMLFTLWIATLSIPSSADTIKICVSGFGLQNTYNGATVLGEDVVLAKVEEKLGRFGNEITVIDRSRLDQVLEELSLQQGGITENRSQEIGKRLGADFMCNVSFGGITQEAFSSPLNGDYVMTSMPIAIRFINVHTGKVESRTYKHAHSDAEPWLKILSFTMDDLMNDLENGQRLASKEKFTQLPILQKGDGFIRIGKGSADNIRDDMEFEIIVSQVTDGFTEQIVYGTAKPKKEWIFQDNAKLEVRKKDRARRGENIVAGIPEGSFLKLKKVRLTERIDPNFKSQPITSIFSR